MSKTINVTGIINADTEKVWQVIAEIGGVDKWLPQMIGECRFEGEGENARRFCELADGSGTIDETITKIDHEDKIFQYTIDRSIIPMTRFLGTIKVRNAGENKTEISWTGEFTPVNEEVADDVGEMLKSAYEIGITNLEEFTATGKVQVQAA